MTLLQIRRSQREAIEYGPSSDFAERLHAHLLEEGFPRSALGSPDDEFAHVRAALREGAELGLESEQALAVWAVLTAEHGLGLRSLRRYDWYDLLARDPRESPDPEWIERVARDVAAFLDFESDRSAVDLQRRDDLGDSRDRFVVGAVP